MTDPRVGSAVWAAYGDALGFITELTDRRGVERRVGSGEVRSTVEWTRQIAGQFGPRVVFPAGSYSDDTQLRLATARAIRGDGEFDVEAFSKVELPVWRAYALGAGRGTRAAASALVKSDSSWCTNFFATESVVYTKSGGNGAAMRIQPHVWAAKRPERLDTFVSAVVRNAVCTHGDPRGILGAVFHAAILGETLAQGAIVGPDRWRRVCRNVPDVLSSIFDDEELSRFWVPLWEDARRERIAKGFAEAAKELESDIGALERALSSGGAYQDIVMAVGAMSPAVRGSGTKTALVAAAAAWLFKSQSPAAALAAVANLTGSDTDTIAAMTGALIGAVTTEAPSGPVQDRDYLSDETARLVKIHDDAPAASFSYPDLTVWRPPRAELDMVGLYGGRTAVCGLGSGTFDGPLYRAKGRDQSSAWRWLRLDFGQTVLIKYRTKLKELGTTMVAKGNTEVVALTADSPTGQGQFRFEESAGLVAVESPSLEDLTRSAIAGDFSPEILGRHLIQLSTGRHGIERAIAYASIIAKALTARKGRRS